MLLFYKSQVPKGMPTAQELSLRAHCLLVTLQPPTMLAKAQKLLAPAPCGQGSCLCMNLLVVSIPRAGIAKELTASSPPALLLLTIVNKVWGSWAWEQGCCSMGTKYRETAGGWSCTPLQMVHGCHHPCCLTTEHQGIWCFY